MNNKQQLLFGKRNLILLIISICLIVLGFILMKGGGSADGISFRDAIFSTRRIVVAPAVCLAGFVLLIFTIMVPPSNNK